jgi:Zn-dependent protease
MYAFSRATARAFATLPAKSEKNLDRTPSGGATGACHNGDAMDETPVAPAPFPPPAAPPPTGAYPSHGTTVNGVPLAHTAALPGALHPAPPAALPGARAEGDPFGKQRKGLRGRIGSILAGIAVVAAKFGTALKTLLVVLPNAKIFITAGTAFVSVAAYSLFFGWPFAAGFVALIFIHEMGHVIALRREGIKASAPMFIPFMGAAITAKSLGDNALAEARVGLAGPILGSLGALAVAVAGGLLHSDMLLALAYLGFLVNLFNLLPVVPLDGGRAMAAMAPWMWFVGFGVLVAMLFSFPPNPILMIIVLFAGFELYRRWKMRKTRSPEQEAYYRVAPRHRLMVAAVYIGLAVGLVIGMGETHILISGGHNLGRL